MTGATGHIEIRNHARLGVYAIDTNNVMAYMAWLVARHMTKQEWINIEALKTFFYEHVYSYADDRSFQALIEMTYFLRT